MGRIHLLQPVSSMRPYSGRPVTCAASSAAGVSSGLTLLIGADLTAETMWPSETCAKTLEQLHCCFRGRGRDGSPCRLTFPPPPTAVRDLTVDGRWPMADVVAKGGIGRLR
eukprot:7152425-Prymnesium_polylepis.1